LVRSPAKEFNIDTACLGLIDFSPGGEVVETAKTRQSRLDDKIGAVAYCN
jgi:hypothetical protein